MRINEELFEEQRQLCPREYRGEGMWGPRPTQIKVTAGQMPPRLLARRSQCRLLKASAFVASC